MPYKNSKKKKEYQRQWYLRNREKRLLKWEKMRREKGIKKRKIYLTKEEKIKATRKNSRTHYRSHLIQERERTKRWRKENPKKQRFMEKRRKARKKGARGSHTFAEWEQLKREYGNICVYCQKAGIKLTEDHITPLSKGGTDFIDNIQPLCFSCNASKQDKIENRMETYLLRFV